MKRVKPPAKDLIVLTDSKETLIAYYNERLKQLQEALYGLNVQDHPIRIQDVCGEIIAIKTKLTEKNLAKWKALIPADYPKTSS